MIRITGIGDHDRPEWLIRINGIRTQGCLMWESAGNHDPCGIHCADLPNLFRWRHLYRCR
jgi:hypothetical protein